ncbi:MAG: hypothetical protein Q8L34_01745, partial [Candidatus Woesearchaeota archaeon]|nr:hypothetical protein [Candidatus Woesearchaeota archaeon]
TVAATAAPAGTVATAFTGGTATSAAPASVSSVSAVAGVVAVVAGAFLLAYGITHGDVGTSVTGGLMMIGGILLLIPGIGWIAGAIVIAVAVIWSFVVGGATIKTNTATITCEPWVAPSGGADCEKCDDDPSKECTEYRCHSLGAACKYLPEDQSCAHASPNDVNSPIISPWPEVLTQGFRINPMTNGYIIRPAVPAFLPITFGIKTDELAQCKIADQHTPTLDAMTQPFGSSGYKLEHKMTTTLSPGRDYTFYVRCQDVNGVPKSDSPSKEYLVQFSINRQPDETPPQILSKSLIDGAFIPSGVTETSLTMYLNEPGYCRWSTQDQNYASMPETQLFLCEDEISQNPLHAREYMCGTMLKGIQDNTKIQYYFRCKDLNNKEQQQSTPFSLQGTTPLQITSLTPQGDILTASPNLQVTTAGGAEQGKASCTYEQEGFNFVPFFTTGSNQHSQSFGPLPQASYTYAIVCTDAAGNTARQTTTFAVTTDTKGPSITQLYTEGSTLHILTNEPSTCSYSTTSSTFSRTEGTLLEGQNTKDHILVINQIHYYVLCWDAQENLIGPITIII